MHPAAPLLHGSQQLLVPIAAAKRAVPRSAGGMRSHFARKTPRRLASGQSRNIAPSGRRDEMSQIRRLAAILATAIRLHGSIERYAGDAGALGEQIFLSPRIRRDWVRRTR